VRSSVRDVPIAVAGPTTAVAQLRTALDQHLPGGFDIADVAETAAAEQLIRDRQVYGAIDLSPGTPLVMGGLLAAVLPTKLVRAPPAGSPGHSPSRQ
jgi:hypothetical protein